VQDHEEVVLVLVDLRALIAREDVLVVEGMEVEVLLEPRAVDDPRALDVDPAQPPGLQELDVGCLGLLRRPDDGATSTPAQAGQVRHGDFVARRSTSLAPEGEIYPRDRRRARVHRLGSGFS
jgi:hypothetical protein